MPKIAQATFTEFDQAQAQAYVDNRSLLFQLWDLAITYPCIASKIEVRIRQADPREDYLYEKSMADAAIVVSLRWMDTSDACMFLQCHNSYPHNGTGVMCGPVDEPRVFPTGDSSIMTACEPGCFFMRNLKSMSTGIPLSVGDIKDKRYAADAFHIMSMHDGQYRRRRLNSVQSRDTTTVATMKTTNDDRGATRSGGDGDDETANGESELTKDPDLALFEYVRESDTCEVANAGLITYITQPWARANSGETNVCRVTNFAIGEDIIYNAKVHSNSMSSNDPTMDAETIERQSTTTGRLTASYCAAFGLDFNKEKQTCFTPLWEDMLTYTFLGPALIRLARHDLHGGDGCDEVFPAIPSSRPDTDPKSVRDRRLLSRRDWYDDVDRAWCCPPPNVLLSDLGVFSRDWIWTNRNGGTVERIKPLDFKHGTIGNKHYQEKADGSSQLPTASSVTRSTRVARHVYSGDEKVSRQQQNASSFSSSSSSSSIIDTDVRGMVRRALQRRNQFGTKHFHDSPFVGSTNDGDSGTDGGGGGDDNDGVTIAMKQTIPKETTAMNYHHRKTKRSIDKQVGSLSLSSKPQGLLNFDDVYTDVSLHTKNILTSDYLRTTILNIAESVGVQVGQTLTQIMLARLMKSAYNRSLRFIGQRFAGKISRTLIGLSLRVATARMISTVLTKLTTSMMLAMSTAATGIGAVIGVFEMITFVLDMAIVFGWDPGNYKVEATNEMFDDMALTWLHARTREKLPQIDPYYILFLYSSTYSRSEAALVADGGDGHDESAEATARPNSKFVIMSKEDVPWFFEKFSVAVRAIINDANGSTNEENNTDFSDNADDDDDDDDNDDDNDDEMTGWRRRQRHQRNKLRVSKLYFDDLIKPDDNDDGGDNHNNHLIDFKSEFGNNKYNNDNNNNNNGINNNTNNNNTTTTNNAYKKYKNKEKNKTNNNNSNERIDITKRARPILSDSPAVCSMLWTIHYFAHRRFNSNGQRVYYDNADDESVELTDDVISSAIRDNEVAAFLQTSLYTYTVPRAHLIGAARRNVVTKGIRLLDQGIAILGATATTLFAGGILVAIVPRISIAAIVMLMFALLFVVLPITLCSTLVEFVAPDGQGDARRTYERKNETTDRDDLDELCDTVINAIFSSLRRDSSNSGDDSDTVTNVLFRELLLNDMQPELRVLRKSYEDSM